MAQAPTGLTGLTALTGAYAAQQLPTQKRQRRLVLGPIIGLAVLALCVLLVVGILTSQLGFGGVFVGALLAMLPVVPMVAAFLWVDRWEPEPPHLLLLAFVWGAGVAALIALVINSTLSALLDARLGSTQGDLVSVSVVAPLVEEGVKGAFVIGMLIFKRREFDGIIDGIVYAGITAVGFAFTENILYIGRTIVDTSVNGQGNGVLAIVILRCVLSPFAHPLFTAMTGIGAGIVASSRSGGAAWLAVPAGYVCAVFLHGLWNGSGSVGGTGGFIGVYAFVMLPVLFAVIGVIVWQRRREQRIVVEQLPSFANAGWIAPSEIALLSSLAGRRGWRAAVRKRSGKTVEKAVSRYQVAVTELAFLRSRMSRGSVGIHGAQWHSEALAELLEARLAAVGHPAALTVALRHHGPQQHPGWTPPPPGHHQAGPGGPRYGGPMPGSYGPPPPNLPPQSWPG